MWKRYVSVTNLDEALAELEVNQDRARIVAGATDLMLELERGARPGIETLIDITRVNGLRRIFLDEQDVIHLGPLVTHNDCVSSELIRNCAYPLARAAWEVGSPQIRNRGTIAGNLITASPANDTITPLMALGASLVLSTRRGDRVVSLADFYRGVRKTVLAPDEIVTDIFFPALRDNQKGIFTKYALRNAQAISLVNLAVIITFGVGKVIESAQITLGAVGPTIVRARKAEAYLVGQRLTAEVGNAAAELVKTEITPIDDLRASARYRRTIAGVIARRALVNLGMDHNSETLPANPVLLRQDRPHEIARQATVHVDGVEIVARVNGKEMRFKSGQGKSLLRLLREEGLLVGTKEGCSEGECGACTVHLDGSAVMSCMVPAPRAHGAEIVTVEGLAKEGVLHPVQEAFIQEGAVQCGYCTPGLLMSGAMLLQERKNPSRSEITQAFTGNLCRCTGYYKIVQAVERAAQVGGNNGEENLRISAS
jgi:carbon-monoxide dehydrogenase medium subunit